MLILKKVLFATIFGPSERVKNVITQGFCINNAWACSWRLSIFIKKWLHPIGIKPYWVALDLALYYKEAHQFYKIGHV
jgi:hypothetical protein